MSLKVELRPGERVIVGRSVITNTDHRTRLIIDGDEPVLREKDILTAETANSPARRIYLAVQLIYLEADLESARETYFGLVNEFLGAAPSTLALVDAMNNEILTGATYKALKIAKKLIEYEDKAIAGATSGRHRLQPDREPHDGPARS